MAKQITDGEWTRKSVNPGPWIARLAVPLLIIITGMSCFTVVQPGNTGVSVYLGRVSATPVESGIHFKWPFVEKIVQVKSWEQTSTTDLDGFSSDMQSIKLNVSVMYRIPPTQVPVLYGQYAGAHAEEWYRLQIEPRVMEICKQVTAMHRAQDLAQKRLESKNEILNRLKEAVTTMEIRDFTLNNIELDPKLKDSIEQKMIADQKAQAKQYELIEAQKQAEITKVEAEAKAAALKVTAEAVAASPGIALIEGIKKWDGKVPNTLVLNTGAVATSTPIILQAQ